MELNARGQQVVVLFVSIDTQVTFGDLISGHTLLTLVCCCTCITVNTSYVLEVQSPL